MTSRRQIDDLVKTIVREFRPERINQQCAEKYLKARLERWPETSRGERRFVLRRFPYSVLYRIRGSEVFITAVAHQKRRPGYWRARR